MRTAFLMLALALLLLLPTVALGQGSRIDGVTPDSAKIGDTLGATGEAIGKAEVTQLYLTDGTTDYKVQILEQTDKSIRFKVPPGVKAGSYRLMILTGGASPKLLEQPVRVSIEE